MNNSITENTFSHLLTLFKSNIFGIITTLCSNFVSDTVPVEPDDVPAGLKQVALEMCCDGIFSPLYALSFFICSLQSVVCMCPSYILL